MATTVKNSKKRKEFLLPSGKCTSSTATYVREWRRLGHPIAKLFGCELYAFDPGLTMQLSNGDFIELPLDVALIIFGLLEKKVKNGRAR